MISYVESNFVLELALGREDAAAAEWLLGQAEIGNIELALPELSIYEPYAVLTQKSRERSRLSRSLAAQVQELQRSVPHQELVVELTPAPELLIRIERDEMDLLEDVVARLLRSARVIHLSEAAFQQSLEKQAQLGLTPQDAIIYSSICDDAQQHPPDEVKIFASKNWKDFGTPEIAAELQEFGCTYCESFDEGRARIEQARQL